MRDVMSPSTRITSTPSIGGRVPAVGTQGPTTPDAVRGAALLALVVGVGALHYATSTEHVVLHELYTYLCYLPIILGAYWYGVWGGFGAAVVMSAAFVPHIRGAWAGDEGMTATRYAQVVVFHLIGLTVGLLAASQRRLTMKYRDANLQLLVSQESLRRADRLSALGEIAAGLAHEIQNPLAAVKGACEIVASRVSTGTPEAEFAELARKELARMEGLVREFLEYARPREPELREADLGSVIDHVALLLRPEAERVRVAMQIARAPSGDRALIDTEQIAQVLFNVMLNAVQASPAGGQVRVDERVESAHAVIDVTDQGPGIPAEHLPRLFEPFFTTKSRGTGLGLAISLRIVTAHGGTIEALPGRSGGTVFRIRLPLAMVASSRDAH